MPFVHLSPNLSRCGIGPLVVALGLLAATLLVSRPGGAFAQQVDLRPQVAEGVRRVTVEWQLSGELKLPAVADTPAAKTTPKVGATAKLAYDEAALDDATQFARVYHQVEATVGVDKHVREQTVRDERRLTLVTPTTSGAKVLAVDGPLRREELDTLQMPADSVVLAELLPNEALAVGGTWDHPPEVITALVNVQTTEVCECQSVLVEANSQFAKCQMAGTLHGTVDGTKTEMELDAIYLVDLARGEICQFNLAIREKRDVGPITPGLEGVLKFRIKIESAKDPILTPDLVERVATSYPVPATAVETHSPELGFSTTHDASWHVTGTRGTTMALRKIGLNGLVTHATLTRLPARQLDSDGALPQFRAEVARTLGESLGVIASEEQFTSQSGCRVLHVVAQGHVGGVPVEWHAYQVAPPADQPPGDRLALTFVVERDKIEELGGQDRQLVERIELLEVEGVETAAGATGRQR